MSEDVGLCDEKFNVNEVSAWIAAVLMFVAAILVVAGHMTDFGDSPVLWFCVGMMATATAIVYGFRMAFRQNEFAAWAVNFWFCLAMFYFARAVRIAA
ncbi:MAG: hypothetical protein AAB407_04045 [Patescibacteria group bacterium]